jgi:2-keto-4-pentenoate hydratase/2-oxohepta-3-ene-1,7-dioic acid hydratase in catechol pathway
MKLVTCEQRNIVRLGILEGETVLLPDPAAGWPGSMLELIQLGPETGSQLMSRERGLPEGERVPLRDLHLLAPIPRPPKNIMCLGLNYADHLAESYAAQGREAKPLEHLVVFTKALTAVNGPYDDIPYDPTVSTALDWEVELGVVIGVGGRAINEAVALRHVFGYTVINDISARDLQFQHKQFFLGKSLDGSCPMGPCIVTADEIPDPHTLALTCRVNGQVKQASNTAHQITSIAKTLAILSKGMTLEPGDIIATGTPSGVGFARTPPEFLRPGDIVESEVERIGCLRNRVASHG